MLLTNLVVHRSLSLGSSYICKIGLVILFIFFSKSTIKKKIEVRFFLIKNSNHRYHTTDLVILNQGKKKNISSY